MNTQRHILITGASKGIGRATALHLARQGFHVFAGVRNAADGEALQREATANLTPVIIDVTNNKQITQAAQQIAQQVGQTGLYGLVNNAGIAVAAPLEFIPVDEFRRQIEVNLVSQLAVTQVFLPCIRQAQGRIINVSSVGGRIAGTMIGAYHASKFGMEAMTDTLRQELRPWGIEVVSIEPGNVATPIWETSSTAFDRLVERMNPQVNELYAKAMERTRATAANATTSGLPPERVAEVIHDALTARRPQTRYLIGTDAQIAARIFARLPDRLRDRLMAMR
jgi:NAD(P)-dependent dehydrogenase (short-subunit alcohol dehydrogenase family)